MLDVDIALHGRRFEASYFAVRDDRGELLAVGKAMIDVTARRQAEAARERLQAGDDRARRRGHRRRRRARDDRAVAAGAGRRHGRRADARPRARAAADDRRPRPLAASARSAGARHARPADAGHARRAHAGRAVFVPDEKALLERSRSWPARRTRARAPTRRCRCWPTAARWACSRSASGAASRFDADERALLNALAGQAAIALARAQLYEREHTVSQTLQASLLPARAAGRARARPRRAGWRPAPRASRSAATSTTRSRSPTAPGGSRSATSAARASTPRR